MKSTQPKENVIHMAKIHDTAIVHPGAKIGKNVEIGPYSIIGPNVEIGENTIIYPHVIIDGWTKIGCNNTIFFGASIGLEPQDKKYHGEKSYLFIGDNNIFREYVTINRGTEGGGGETRIGNNNLIMAYCHVAHDCQLSNNIIMSNAANLAGHVFVEDYVVIGGLAGVHQFVRIGKMAMVGAHTKVVKDIPPYVTVDGHPARVAGINIVGLRRNGLLPEVRDEIKRAYKILYRTDLSVSAAIEKMDQDLQTSPEIEHFLSFLRNATRGIVR